MRPKKVQYSIIILLEEEHEDFHEFMKNLHDVFLARGASFEIVIVANGTGSFLRNELTKLEGFNHSLKAYGFNTKTTQAVCLKTALAESSGDILCVFGYYQQITSESLNQLLDSLDDETDIISPWRQHRVDPWLKQLQSKAFNILVRWIIRYDLHDLSCTVRIFRREALEKTEIYGNLYRFLPILASRKGFRTKEVKCQHYREPGKTYFFSLPDYLTRLIDIFTLYFNIRFTRKPLRFFSSIGLGFLLIGLLITSYIFVQRFFMGYPIGDRPTLLLAIFFMLVGVQVASVGLLGEIVAFIHGRHRKEYTVEKKI